MASADMPLLSAACRGQTVQQAQHDRVAALVTLHRLTKGQHSRDTENDGQHRADQLVQEDRQSLQISPALECQQPRHRCQIRPSTGLREPQMVAAPGLHQNSAV